MQRAYDQIMHDILLQDLPAVFCMDRAGLVGPDGPTHHGVFDISMLNSFPNIVISAPKDGQELSDLIYTGILSKKAFAIRYPTSRLALLYCLGAFGRRGHASALLAKVESGVRQDGVKILTTEASFFSYPLLMKLGWSVCSKERIFIKRAFKISI